MKKKMSNYLSFGVESRIGYGFINSQKLFYFIKALYSFTNYKNNCKYKQIIQKKKGFDKSRGKSVL